MKPARTLTRPRNDNRAFAAPFGVGQRIKGHLWHFLTDPIFPQQATAMFVTEGFTRATEPIQIFVIKSLKHWYKDRAA
jgi:hypothetical protein